MLENTAIGKFENRCPGCDRNFRNPDGIREHRNYTCTQNKAAPTRGRRNYKEPSHHDAQRRPIQDFATHIPEESTHQDLPWRGGQRQLTEEDAAEEQQKARNNTTDENVDRNGYMTSLGTPRQPKTTQENRTGTLRYEQETETWQCTKCDKNYTNQNARSARCHAAEHAKAEKNHQEEMGKTYYITSPDETKMKSEYEHCEAMGKNIAA